MFYISKYANIKHWDKDAQRSIARINADNGYANEHTINTFVKGIKSIGLWENVDIAYLTGFGHKRDGSNYVSKIYDLRNKLVDSTGTPLDPFQNNAALQQRFVDSNDAPIISDSVSNGGFETAGAGGTDVFGTWTDAVTGSTTMTRDTSVYETGSASCRIDFDEIRSNFSLYQFPAGISGGNKYKMSIRAKSSVAGALMRLITENYTGTPFNLPPLTTEWATYSVVGIGGGSVAIGRAPADINQNNTVWIDSVTLERVEELKPTLLFDPSRGGYYTGQLQTALSAPSVWVAVACKVGTDSIYRRIFDGVTAESRQGMLFAQNGTQLLVGRDQFDVTHTIERGQKLPLIAIAGMGNSSNSWIKTGDTVTTGNMGSDPWLGLSLGAPYTGTTYASGAISLVLRISGYLEYSDTKINALQAFMRDLFPGAV